METPVVADLWRAYGRHAALLFSGGPAPLAVHADCHLFVASGGSHVDLNQAVLFGNATADDARAVAALAGAGGYPVLLGCSRDVSREVEQPLAEAGFTHLATSEYLFWAAGAPPATPAAAFPVRRVETVADVSAMTSIFVEGHDYEPELVEGMYRELVLSDRGISGWLAWDGAEPVSFTFVTRIDGSLVLWEVLTPTRHRRRGAARAVIGAALNEVAREAGGEIEQTFFWSTPAGKPLYDSLGFSIVDIVDTWVLGASEADLAIVGAEPAT